MSPISTLARTHAHKGVRRYARTLSAPIEMMPSTYVNRDSVRDVTLASCVRAEGRAVLYEDTGLLCSKDSGLLMLGAVNNLPISSSFEPTASPLTFLHTYIILTYLLSSSLSFFFNLPSSSTGYASLWPLVHCRGEFRVVFFDFPSSSICFG